MCNNSMYDSQVTEANSVLLTYNIAELVKLINVYHTIAFNDIQLGIIDHNILSI